MRGNSIFEILIALGMLLFAQTLHGQDEPGIGTTNPINILVNSNDVAGVAIHRTAIREWVTSINAAGKPLGMQGIVQEVEVQGIKARIQYAEFESDEDAHQAAEFHVENVASIFQRGLWEAARRQLIGDETWFSRNAETLAILFRSGKICALVSCHGTDTAKLGRVAEMLAERIVHKANKGARVPLSLKEAIRSHKKP